MSAGRLVVRRPLIRIPFLSPCHIRFIFHFPLISITNEFSEKWKTLKMLFGQIFWSKLCYLVKTLAICRKSKEMMSKSILDQNVV